MIIKKKILDCFRLLVEVWQSQLVGAQKEVSTVAKAYIILENAYILNRLLVKIWILKVLLVKPQGNEEHVFRNWRRGDIYEIVGTNIRMATSHKTMEYLYIAEKNKVNLELCIQRMFLWRLKKNKNISANKS